MTQSESGGGSGCVRTSKGRQNPSQGFIKACKLFNWTFLDRISCIDFIISLAMFDTSYLIMHFFFGTHTCLCRLQNWPYFDVCKYARALTQKVCNEVENGFSEARAQDSYATLDKGRLCVGDWRLIGFSWPYSNILEIVWAFPVFWSLPKHSLPRSGGNAFTKPRSSTW